MKICVHACVFVPVLEWEPEVTVCVFLFYSPPYFIDKVCC